MSLMASRLVNLRTAQKERLGQGIRSGRYIWTRWGGNISEWSIK